MANCFTALEAGSSEQLNIRTETHPNRGIDKPHANALALPTMLSALLLVAVLLKLGLEISKIIRAVFFPPLRNVPGPWFAAHSDLWLTTHVFRFQQTEAIHKLLQKYGPVVRIGPKKIAFCNPDAMRDIYLVKKFDKSMLYKNFKVLVAVPIYLFPLRFIL